MKQAGRSKIGQQVYLKSCWYSVRGRGWTVADGGGGQVGGWSFHKNTIRFLNWKERASWQTQSSLCKDQSSLWADDQGDPLLQPLTILVSLQRGEWAKYKAGSKLGRGQIALKARRVCHRVRNAHMGRSRSTCCERLSWSSMQTYQI